MVFLGGIQCFDRLTAGFFFAVTGVPLRLGVIVRTFVLVDTFQFAPGVLGF